VAAGLGALRDDDIRAGRRGLARLRNGHHLADQPRAGLAHGGSKRPWITEGQHDGRGLMGNDRGQHPGALRQAPGDEATADPGVARARPLPLDPAAIAIAATDQAQPTGVAHRRGQPAAGDNVHGGKQNWMFNSKRPGQPILDSHRDRAFSFVSSQPNCPRASRARSLPIVKVQVQPIRFAQEPRRRVVLRRRPQQHNRQTRRSR
jgi:hypothetical protein